MAKKIGTLTGKREMNINDRVLTIMYDESRTYPYYAVGTAYQSKTLKNLIKKINTYYFYNIEEKLTVYGVTQVPRSFGSIYNEVS